MKKTTYTVASVPAASRKSHRVYTHAVIRQEPNARHVIAYSGSKALADKTCAAAAASHAKWAVVKDATFSVEPVIAS